MISAITPGPWKVAPGQQVWTTNSSESCHPLLIARVDTPVGYAEQNANLRAIAATPELIDALEGMLGLIDIIDGRDDLPPDLKSALRLSHRVIAARAVIAKVRAEQEAA